MTAVSLLRRGGLTLERIFFAIARLNPEGGHGRIRNLGTIQAAFFIVIARFPAFADREPEVDVRSPLLIFEANYDGTFEQYIDEFCDSVPSLLNLLWFTSYGYPKAQPSSPFKDYIRANEQPVGHFYMACEQATTRTILAGRQLQAKSARLAGRAGRLPAPGFARAYDQFVRDVQGLL
jgi:hypothetical protein